MCLEKAIQLYPLPRELYKPYIRVGIQPPLDINRVTSEFIFGDRRQVVLKTPVTGDGSLILSYSKNGKTKEGGVVSLKENNSDLLVLQVQGATSGISYRLLTGLRWESFAADQIRRIGCFLAKHGSIDRIAVPFFIEGIDSAKSENAYHKYQIVAARLGLKPSTEEKMFVGEIDEVIKQCPNCCLNCLPSGEGL